MRQKLLTLGLLVIISLFTLFPYLNQPQTNAQTVNPVVWINEILWAGTAASASDEYIELAGQAGLDLTDWSLIALDGSPAFSLTGVISDTGFYLLERTDDTTVADVPADQIYSGGLQNGGEVLQLIDNTGTVVDELDAREGWPAGSASPRSALQLQGDGFITNDCQAVSGALDADGNPICGSPGSANPFIAPPALPAVKFITPNVPTVTLTLSTTQPLIAEASYGDGTYPVGQTLQFSIVDDAGVVQLTPITATIGVSGTAVVTVTTMQTGTAIVIAQWDSNIGGIVVEVSETAPPGEPPVNEYKHYLPFISNAETAARQSAPSGAFFSSADSPRLAWQGTDLNRLNLAARPQSALSCPSGSVGSQAGVLDVTFGAENPAHPLEHARDGKNATYYCYADQPGQCDQLDSWGMSIKTIHPKADITSVKYSLTSTSCSGKHTIQSRSGQYKSIIYIGCASLNEFELQEFHYCVKDAAPTNTPTPKPTKTPTPKPTKTPTLKPTKTPTPKPTKTPTPKPTKTPTLKPTKTPTLKPTKTPTSKPTNTPTAKPTKTPTTKPTKTSTPKPTKTPTPKPTNTPTPKPTKTPTLKPTKTPTSKPTDTPTPKPTKTPTLKPTKTPTPKPTNTPTPTPKPTKTPTPTATPVIRVWRFELVNTQNNRVIREVKDGNQLNLSKFPRTIDIQAVASGQVESIVFLFDQQTSLDNTKPYRLNQPLTVGNYSLKASPFDQDNGQGFAGRPKTITFSVINPTPTATSTPIDTPTPEPTATVIPTETLTPESTATSLPPNTPTPEPTATLSLPNTPTPQSTVTSPPPDTPTPAATTTPEIPPPDEPFIHLCNQQATGLILTGVQTGLGNSKRDEHVEFFNCSDQPASLSSCKLIYADEHTYRNLSGTVPPWRFYLVTHAEGSNHHTRADNHFWISFSRETSASVNITCAGRISWTQLNAYNFTRLDGDTWQVTKGAIPARNSGDAE